jgi:hypothetical protein
MVSVLGPSQNGQNGGDLILLLIKLPEVKWRNPGDPTAREFVLRNKPQGGKVGESPLGGRHNYATRHGGPEKSEKPETRIEKTSARGGENDLDERNKAWSGTEKQAWMQGSGRLLGGDEQRGAYW